MIEKDQYNVNFELIIKNMIFASLFNHEDEHLESQWHIIYDHKLFKKLKVEDETIQQIIDFFYKAVLQYESEKETW